MTALVYSFKSYQIIWIALIIIEYNENGWIRGVIHDSVKSICGVTFLGGWSYHSFASSRVLTNKNTCKIHVAVTGPITW